jgi:uncharacterized integral membrane protein
MTSLFRTFLFWTLALLAAAIAVANRAPARLSFDPFSPDKPAIALDVPLFWIILGSALVGLVLGGWSSWLTQAPLRRTLRERDEQIRRLERELEAAQAIIVRPAGATGTALARH